MAPHDGVGGCTPSPRNDKAASDRIAPARPSVAITITGLMTLGSTWRTITRGDFAPSAFAAVTYSISRTLSTWPRTRRAYPTQPIVASARITLLMLGPRTATSAI